MRRRRRYLLTEDPYWAAATRFAFTAALPRLAYRLRWPTRLGMRGLVAFVAFKTAVGLWFLHRLYPEVARIREEHAGLVAKLGREPTRDELAAHWRRLVEDAGCDGS
jgi:hypothetical protein